MPEDVTPADPSAAVALPAPTQDAGSAPGDVAPVSAGDDRPVQNAVAEFNRKMSKLQSQYDTLMQYVVAQAQSPQKAAEPKGDPTDDELWTLAQQGDRRAFDIYMRRIAAQSQQVSSRQYEYQRLVENQLSILAQRYPVLNDASHPLTQQVNATYQALTARGYAAGPATTLEAIKTAIADRPDLVAELHTRTQPVRQTRAQAGVTGATVREPTSAPASKPLSEKEADLARRMGVRDPAKAKARFQQRQDSGQSSVADTLHPFIREE